jgi:CubicO group peptidase (beta-lactamase class C family)
MPDLTFAPNPDLLTGADRKAGWNQPENRRYGFHNLHEIGRYGQSFRASHVLELAMRADISIAAREDVGRLTGLPWFSAMVVARGGEILYEKYAPDFGPDQPHSIMSISKTTMNLVIGQLWAEGKLSLDEKIGDCLPWVGAGYAGATIQEVLNMDVLNDYSEDYANPMARVWDHEVASGFRLPEGDEREVGTLEFLATIGLAPGAADCRNQTGEAMYRSANTDILAAIAEVRGGRRISSYLADIADAAGLEGSLHTICDRDGFVAVSGGHCLTARDLARYGLLIARRGQGAAGHCVGSADFIEATLQGGVPMPAPRGRIRYSNQTNTDGRWLGHGGYGGQYMLIDMQSGTVGVFFSVLENAAGYDADYYVPIIAMLEAIATGR